MRLTAPSGDGAIVAGGRTAAVLATAADNVDEGQGALYTYSALAGFDGATLDMVRVGANNADAKTALALGVLESAANAYGYNGTTWDRIRSEGTDRDAIAASTLGNLQTLGFLHGYNGASWDRLQSEGSDRDAISALTLGLLQTLCYPNIYNGTTWDRQRSLGSASLNGLGQLSTSGAVPGASVITSHFDVSASNTTTRYTLVTPTSGKRIRVVSIDVLTRGGPFDLECYFGTGANIGSTAANAIATASLHVQATNEAASKLSRIWGDGAGPVGGVDSVVSLRTTSDAGTDIDAVIHYREE